MNNTIDIAYINPSLNDELLHLQEVSGSDSFNLKKIYFTDKEQVDHLMNYYPGAEIVDDLAEIVSDESIKLVLVSAQATIEKPAMEQVLQSGKPLRIV